VTGHYQVVARPHGVQIGDVYLLVGDEDATTWTRGLLGLVSGVIGAGNVGTTTRCGHHRVVRLALVLGVSVLLLTSCSDTYDAYFVNPCERPVRVATFDQRGDERLSGRRATIPPLTVRKVKDAFTDGSGGDWLVVVDGRTELEVDGERWENDTVVIPASACPG
jgi:hypothetical protein